MLIEEKIRIMKSTLLKEGKGKKDQKPDQANLK